MKKRRLLWESNPLGGGFFCIARLCLQYFYTNDVSKLEVKQEQN